ncbi:MAG: HAMP domain-containing histidine kinase [Myxococcales bacterium]|nr:HAMP domain-containing histidine kinase [Myxococcales bacterium]
MRTTPPTAAVSAVLACIQPDNPELVQRWADALASVGGLYATWDASALAAVARGSLAALRYALDHGATELPVEQARRYVDPPQYRRQPLDEFVLAGLRVEHALRAYVAAQSNVPEVSADAADRVSSVFAGSLLQVVRLREQRLSAGQLLADIGRMLASAPPLISLGRVAGRLAQELGGGCMVLGFDGEGFDRMACHRPGGPEEALWPRHVPSEGLESLADVLEGRPVSLPLAIASDALLQGLRKAGYQHLDARPLLIAGDVIGALLLLEPDEQLLDGRALGHIDALCPLLAAHVALGQSTGELLQADAAITGLLEASPTMMCTLDRQGRLRRTNGHFRRRIGVMDDLGGMPLSWLLHPSWSERFPEQWAAVLEARSGLSGNRVDLISVDGNRLALAIEARWLPDEVSPPRTCLMAFWAIDQFVMRAEADAERIDRLGAFVRDVSHDLRAPLRTAGGYAGIIAEELDGTHPELEDYARRLENSVARMDRMIDGLLRYHTSGRLDTNLEEVSAGWLADEAEGRLEGELTARGLTVVRELAGPPLLGDRDALAAIVSNLLDNAARHSPEGGTIRIVLTAVEPGWANLSVCDEGPGVAEADRERVFKLFETVEGSGGQTGVGLAIVKRAVQAHGGRVNLTEAEGGGACFTARLPTP